MTANYTPEEIKKAHEILYNEGIKMRYQVAGKEYVDKSLAAASNPFAKAMQEVSSAVHIAHQLHSAMLSITNLIITN